jgi:GT2 family glycosyltransferase
MDLSIVILNYNNSALLRGCISSVKSATRKSSYEIILVDNGSTDDSVAVVKRSFPDVAIIENKANLGFSRANNRGIAASRGRYVCLLNNDTTLKDPALDLLVAFMDANPGSGACGPQLLNTDGNPQRQGGLLGQKFWRSGRTTEVDFIMGACLIIRVDALKKIGNLDENLFFYNDDLDVCKSLRKTGWKIYFVPEAQATHIGGYSTRGAFNRRMFVEGFRGGLYFCKKHYGPVAFQMYRAILVILFPFAVLGLALSSALRSFREFKDKLLAYCDILKIALFGPVEYPWGK